ncbi:uncharacterized protein LOC144983742 isoform X5 [Oryzias latipes]
MTERTGHTPDPADPEGLRYAVKQQGIALGRQADALSQLLFPLPVSPLFPPPFPHQKTSVFSQSRFTAMSKPVGAFCSNAAFFFNKPQEFKLVFDQPRKQEEAARWTDPVLRGVFYQSLSETIKDHLCSQPETHSFEELVTAALRSDTRLRERQHERPSPTRRTSTTPMQADFPVPSYPKRRNVQKREDNKVSSEEDSEDEKYYPVPLEPGETYCDQSELTPEVCDPTHENSEHIHQTGNTLPVLEEEPERAGGTQHCSDTEDSIASPPALIDCGEERHQRPQRSHRRPKVFTYDTLGTPACYKIGTHSYYMDWNMPQLNTVPTYYQLTPYGY